MLMYQNYDEDNNFYYDDENFADAHSNVNNINLLVHQDILADDSVVKPRREKNFRNW